MFAVLTMLLLLRSLKESRWCFMLLECFSCLHILRIALQRVLPELQLFFPTNAFPPIPQKRKAISFSKYRSIDYYDHICQCHVMVSKASSYAFSVCAQKALLCVSSNLFFLFNFSLHNVLFSEEWSGAGLGCPGMWWSHQTWMCSRSVWMLC